MLCVAVEPFPEFRLILHAVEEAVDDPGREECFDARRELSEVRIGEEEDRGFLERFPFDAVCKDSLEHLAVGACNGYGDASAILCGLIEEACE